MGKITQFKPRLSYQPHITHKSSGKSLVDAEATKYERKRISARFRQGAKKGT